MFWTLIYLSCFGIFLRNSLALTEDQRTRLEAKIKQPVYECFNKSYGTLNTIFSRNDSFPEDDSSGCFIACVFRRTGIFNEKGEFSKTKALEAVKVIFETGKERDIMVTFLDTCAKVNQEKVNDTEGCDRAKFIFSCFVDNREKLKLDFLDL